MDFKAYIMPKSKWRYYARNEKSYENFRKLTIAIIPDNETGVKKLK